VAREKATRKLEAMFMTSFPSRRFDEVSFPGLWPVKELRLRPEPFATTAEFDRGVGERAVELVGELADRSVGIFSLSRVLNEPMRAYNSDSHAGLVVGFNENHPLFAGSCFEVEYSDTPFKVSSNDGWAWILGATIRDKDILESKLKAVPFKLFLRKRPDRQHEQEVRLIALPQEGNQRHCASEQAPQCTSWPRMPPQRGVGRFRCRAGRTASRHRQMKSRNKDPHPSVLPQRDHTSPRNRSLIDHQSMKVR